MPAFLLNPWVIGSTIALFGFVEYNKSDKGTVSNGEFIVNPEFDIPDPDPVNPVYKGLQPKHWDDAIVGLIVLGMVLAAATRK